MKDNAKCFILTAASHEEITYAFFYINCQEPDMVIAKKQNISGYLPVFDSWKAKKVQFSL